MAAPTASPTRLSIAEATAELKKAAYFSMYSVPNPNSSNVPVASLDPVGFVQVQVHEQLHRFPVDLAEGTQVGGPIATVSMKWTPSPENFVPIPNVTPPPTALSVSNGQSFVTMDGTLAFADGSAMHGFGHGHTYSQVADGSGVLYLGAVVNMMSGVGHLRGGQGGVVVNGHIRPPVDLRLSVVGRFLDPDGKFKGKEFVALDPVANPDPTYVTVMFLSEVDPNNPIEPDRDDAGKITGWKMNAVLRLISTNWDTSGPQGLRSEMTEGPVVGNYTARVTIDFKSKDPNYIAYVVTTQDGTATFKDLKGNPVGTVSVDMEVANAFDIAMPTVPTRMWRLGGIGPVKAATGIFENTQGVQSVNGAFTLDPVAQSALHILRIYDPVGRIRALMRDSWGQETRKYPATDLNDEEVALVAAVDDSLALGLALKSWWEKKDADNTLGERFELVRSYNPAERAYGFFDTATIRQGSFSVMGLLQEMAFDCPKSTDTRGLQSQLREYVMRYFMRSTAFTAPIPYTGRIFGEPPGLILGLLFNNTPNEALRGFGYTQNYYKTLDGNIGAFDAGNQHDIVDLRTIGTRFEWIMLQVQLFNFVVPFKPLGENLPQIGIPLQEKTWIVINKDFVVDKPGEYGLGYALLRGGETSAASILAYGPGRFQLGFQTIHFKMDPATGATRVSLAFASNKPQKIMNIPYDPVGLGFRALSTVTLGYLDQYTKYLTSYLPGFLTPSGVDPMQLYIAAANYATAGAASQHFGINKAELDRLFLLQHFNQHYQMILGAQSTYHTVPDWLAAASIPDWVRSGSLEAEAE
jgi:hypothetical protein